jgi:hypothetical protein
MSSSAERMRRRSCQDWRIGFSRWWIRDRGVGERRISDIALAAWFTGSQERVYIQIISTLD